jgi:hypothetical protein
MFVVSTGEPESALDGRQHQGGFNGYGSLIWKWIFTQVFDAAN